MVPLGLSIDGPCRSSPADVIDDRELRETVDALFIVLVRDKFNPPMEMRASARSKTFPEKTLAKEPLCGVDGTVA